MSQEDNIELNLVNKNSTTTNTKNLNRSVEFDRSLSFGSKIKTFAKYFVVFGLIVSTLLTIWATAGKLGGPPLPADTQTQNLNNLSKLLEALQTVAAPVARFRPIRYPRTNSSDLVAWRPN